MPVFALCGVGISDILYILKTQENILMFIKMVLFNWQYNRLHKFCKVFVLDTVTVRIRTVVVIMVIN